jgi:hypothetical protein
MQEMDPGGIALVYTSEAVLQDMVYWSSCPSSETQDYGMAIRHLWQGRTSLLVDDC